MEVDVQPALSSSPALILGSSPGNTAVSSGPAIDAVKKQKIANAVGMTAFGELWEAMNCSISGSRLDGFKLNFKCGCARNKQRISFRVPVDKPWTWADECQKLKTRVVELHCGEQCTPTLSAKARPQVKRPQEDNWLSEYADKSKKQKEEAAHRKAVAGTETLATTLVQEVAQLKEKIKDLEAELTKDKAAADRRALAIDPNNADGFDYEREDADTGGKQS